MAKMTMPAFERSKFDKDKGMKEGSPADITKDKAALSKINKTKGAKPAKGKR